MPDISADDEFEAGLPSHFLRGLDDADDQPPAARWTNLRELQGAKWQWRSGAYFLGYRAGMAIGRMDDRHLLLVAGSRSGKGVSVVLPNCLLWPGSVLAIDPKGELADKTAGHRSQSGQRVIVLDPFGISRHPSGTYNPLAEIDPEAPEAADRVALIVDALIVHGGGDTHWTDGAKQLVKGLIIYVLSLPQAERDLVTVRDLLMLKSHLIPAPEGGDTIADCMYYLMTEGDTNEGIRGIARGIGLSFLAKPDKESASILSAAQTQTDFLDSKPLRDTLRGFDGLRLADLKRGGVTVYLCLKATQMGTHARWLRIIINLALAALESAPIKDMPPVLLILEEFNVLGHMASIETAAGQIAGCGVRILTVLQDLSQLKNHYKASWETFIGNAGLVLAFGNSDATTLEYLSKKIGTLSINVETRNAPTMHASIGGATGLNYSAQSVPLLSPHEVEQAFARERERMLVLYSGGKPIALRRAISQDDPRFRPLLDLPLDSR